MTWLKSFSNDTTRYFIKPSLFLSHVVFAYYVVRKNMTYQIWKAYMSSEMRTCKFIFFLFLVWQKTKMYLTWIRKMMIVMVLFVWRRKKDWKWEWTTTFFEGVNDEVWEWCVRCQIMIGSNMSSLKKNENEEYIYSKNVPS